MWGRPRPPPGAVSRHHPCVRRLAMRVPVALLLVGLVVGRRAEGQRVTDGKDVVVFENATIDIVRVYLIDRGSDWLLGRAEPGRVTVLPLPACFAGQAGGEVW